MSEEELPTLQWVYCVTDKEVLEIYNIVLAIIDIIEAVVVLAIIGVYIKAKVA
eukprot:CAMPEP_0202692272 /NCGR_PEP_ID=MMETSP1385-20130828/6689_1 /ASSEMBLY_ACC=CAM_ASM_000861 /TAXON_ID=933848 /ORGANISM="Elphidium margaritaceum" /LENGTH=52 /DNA_ID=CAMNT_0049347767 /DNA_START=8 /DNA_END=162 /DNA_ORIENTATION=+